MPRHRMLCKAARLLLDDALYVGLAMIDWSRSCQYVEISLSSLIFRSPLFSFEKIQFPDAINPWYLRRPRAYGDQRPTSRTMVSRSPRYECYPLAGMTG